MPDTTWSTYCFGVIPRGLRLFLNLLAVLVRAGEEHHVVPLNPFIPRHGIRHHGAVSVADV